MTEPTVEPAMRLITEPPELITVPMAMHLLNIGKSKTYDLLRSGTLRSVKIGRRRLIPREAITETIASLLQEAV